MSLLFSLFFFFFNDTATTEIYTLSLHDALPISAARNIEAPRHADVRADDLNQSLHPQTQERAPRFPPRSEEHTSELQSRLHLVCRLLLEKKKKNTTTINHRSLVRRVEST